MKTFFFLLGSVFISKCELCKFSLFASFHFLDFYFNSILIRIKSSRRHPRTEMKTVCVLEHVRSDKRSVYGFFGDSQTHSRHVSRPHACVTHSSLLSPPPALRERARIIQARATCVAIFPFHSPEYLYSSSRRMLHAHHPRTLPLSDSPHTDIITRRTMENFWSFFSLVTFFESYMRGEVEARIYAPKLLSRRTHRHTHQE